MAVAFGENDVKTVEDVAGLVPDDLRGYTEGRGEDAVHEAGILESFNLSQAAATDMIMQARVMAGWITAEELAEQMGEAEDESDDVQSADAENAAPAEPTAESVFDS